MKYNIKNITASLTVIIAVLVLLAPSKAFSEGFAGSAGAFLRMGSGAAAVAAGDAGVARAIGAQQAFYNPAGMPYAPNNEIYIGYHVLSLDRKLGHISGMYQIPQIKFWQEPIVPIRARRVELSDNYLTLVASDALRQRSDEDFRVKEYLPSLIQAILNQVNNSADNSEITLLIDHKKYNAGIFEEFIKSISNEAKSLGLDTAEKIKKLIEQKYMLVQKKPAAIAVSWTHAGTDDIEGRDYNGVKYGDLGFYENRFSLSFGLKIHPKLSAGVSMGMLYALVPNMIEDESKALTSSTIGVDAGVQYRPFLNSLMPYRLNTFVIGAAAYDLGGKNTWNSTGYWSLGTEKNDYFPDRFRLGIAYQPINGFSTYFDLETDLKELVRPKLGLEYLLLGKSISNSEQSGSIRRIGNNNQPMMVLRCGLDRDRPTFGLGLKFRLAGIGETVLDYAYIIEPVSPEATQVLSWRFNFAS
jgi:hypothetical protein